ncbi:hypothetical protein EVAR_24079_1 [Eumeta japonica]|uniref:Uncharacterized protein n=1 Tax=Eumeta variegata TaxID=151549 RepID=A0A4C1ZWY7_EUMVA|nr:hypothetical protein EVAR_24079_1 [Eumeta japonica]
MKNSDRELSSDDEVPLSEIISCEQRSPDHFGADQVTKNRREFHPPESEDKKLSHYATGPENQKKYGLQMKWLEMVLVIFPVMIADQELSVKFQTAMENPVFNA